MCTLVALKKILLAQAEKLNPALATQYRLLAAPIQIAGAVFALLDS
jgi:hypothetical protein